jgi:hypothetical protein
MYTRVLVESILLLSHSFSLALSGSQWRRGTSLVGQDLFGFTPTRTRRHVLQNVAAARSTPLYFIYRLV